MRSTTAIGWTREQPRISTQAALLGSIEQMSAEPLLDGSRVRQFRAWAA